MVVDAARAKSLFLAASDLADPAGRAALETHCAACSQHTLQHTERVVLCGIEGNARAAAIDATRGCHDCGSRCIARERSIGRITGLCCLERL